MKKVFAILLIPFIISNILISCSNGGNRMFESDRKKANRLFDEILDALESKDQEQLLSLFSKNVRETVLELEEQADDLSAYYTGITESYNDHDALYVQNYKEDDRVFQYMEATYDVKTTADDYRFAIGFYTDDSYSDNIGVLYLYVIRSKDDCDLEYAYWGDGKNRPGINIGKQNFVPDDTIINE